MCAWGGGVSYASASMHMLFTVPRKAPTIISADRTEANRVLVKWEHLKSEDLRGNLLCYEIAYYDLLEQRCPGNTYRSGDNTTMSVTGGDSHAVIANLDPRLEYCVAVAAKTGAGVGEFSYITIPCMSTPEACCS